MSQVYHGVWCKFLSWTRRGNSTGIDKVPQENYLSNSHLMALITTPKFFKRSTTNCTSSMRSSIDELAISTSSTYSQVKYNPYNTWSINLWKYCAAFFKQIGARKNSNNPNYIVIAVFWNILNNPCKWIKCHHFWELFDGRIIPSSIIW